MHGLPTIGHCHPVIEYVLSDVGILADLSTPGNLAKLFTEHFKGSAEIRCVTANAESRRASVQSRFSWERLRPEYTAMFKSCVGQPEPSGKIS